MARYRFAEFVVSPRRRVLLHRGCEIPLIPRYFDLLVFLIERRADAVHRRDIFDRVWSDVVVSDSALSQAIRTIRRALGDDSREPRFVKTVSRHGYQFVCADLIEEVDEGAWPPVAEGESLVTITASTSQGVTPAEDDREWADLIAQIKMRPESAAAEEDQRDAAERLHNLGTAETLARLGTGADGAYARALLRDTRWDVPGAGPVTIAGQPHAGATARHLVRLRLRRLLGVVAARWATGAAGAGAAGLIGGLLGGLLLLVASAGATSPSIVPVLGAIGTVCGSVAGAGVGAGIAVAEAIMRSRRTLALGLGGALGGWIVGLAVQALSKWTLEVLVGVAPPIGGSVEGPVIGLAAGLGFAVATRSVIGGPAAPRGRSRVRVAATAAAACAGAALLLSLAGLPLVGGSIHLVAQAAHGGGEPLLAPLGQLIGEPDFGPLSAALIAMGEGAFFGGGLALGITRRR